MLYITTRDHNEVFTAARTLQQPINSAQGPYVPFRFPAYSADDIAALKDKPFGQCVADLLNLFFSTQLTGWDVDFSIGRNPLKVTALDKRTVIAEAWHNPQSDYNYVISSLYKKICGDTAQTEPTEWAVIAIRIATLFAAYGEMLREQAVDPGQSFDIAMAADDLSLLISTWYAKIIGLPIGMIVAGSSDSWPLWDLIMRGSVSTRDTYCPHHAGLERLIHIALGQNEACRYTNSNRTGTMYLTDESLLSGLKQNIFAAVVGKSRIDSTINQVYRSALYRFDLQTALAYNGLQDYRAKTGESKTALLIAHQSIR